MPDGRRKFPAYAVYHLFWGAMDWLYPPYCGGCEKPGERWCSDCQANVETIDGPICPVCGIPYPGQGSCPICRKNPPAYQALRSWGRHYGPLREAVKRLKYKQDLGLAEPLAKNMVKLLHEQNWPVDFITTVPLGKLRLRNRGYNQAKQLALPISWMVGVPYIANAVVRIRETRSQVGLSAKERLTNVSGAFRANPASVSGKTILVIDDVATTGATLNACAQSFVDAGARAVYALTLSRAFKISDHTLDPP